MRRRDGTAMALVTERGVDIDPEIGDRHISGQGTPEHRWRTWDGLPRLPDVTADELVPPGSRAVIVAPHPDDEVLACGGLLSLLGAAGRDVLVIGVTDGEASHPGSSKWTPRLLAQRRRQERETGLQILLSSGLSTTVALALPDGGVALHEARLQDDLKRHLLPRDVVLTTWRLDGHPDHEATGRAAVAAARWRGVRCWEMPVWMWHWARPDDGRVPWRRMRRLALDGQARSRKSRAIAAHGTQLVPSPADGTAPVLPDWALARLLRPFEVFIASEPSP